MDVVDAPAVAEAYVMPGAARQPTRITHTLSPVDTIYRWSTFVLSLTMVASLVAILGVILTTAWPAFGRLGFAFFTDQVWNSTTDHYGTLTFFVGTVITTALALLIAIPVSLAIAILLTEFLPPRLSAVLGIVVDVAAGVPTIVFGVWAVLTLVPWMRDSAEPGIQNVLGWLPIFRTPMIGYVTGLGMFTTGLVLAAMVFPTIVSITRNSFLAIPRELREASLGLGATRWETATRVVMRQARPGILGATILACGRSLGEAMAVTYIIGSVPKLPESLFDVGDSLPSRLLNEAGGTIPGALHTGALYELGFVLLLLALLTSLVGRLLTGRLAGLAIAGGAR